MISHQYRCIFIHIPRTAGSSIERWIHGSDWWDYLPATKHLLASQAKRAYPEHWDNYFKFTFVRDPWDRMISCLQHADHFGMSAPDDSHDASANGRRMIDLSGYKKLFGYPITVEHDHRFFNRDDVAHAGHQAHCVYQNIIDEPVDFVGRFETLQRDIQYIAKRVGIDQPFNFHHQKSQRRDRRRCLDDSAIEQIRQLHAGDLETFGYRFEPERLSANRLKCA